MRAKTLTLLSSAVLLAACEAQTNQDANDVLEMENATSGAVPVNGATATLGTSTTGAGAVQSAVLRTSDGALRHGHSRGSVSSSR